MSKEQTPPLSANESLRASAIKNNFSINAFDNPKIISAMQEFAQQVSAEKDSKIKELDSVQKELDACFKTLRGIDEQLACKDAEIEILKEQTIAFAELKKSPYSDLNIVELNALLTSKDAEIERLKNRLIDSELTIDACMPAIKEIRAALIWQNTHKEAHILGKSDADLIRIAWERLKKFKAGKTGE